MKKCALTAVLAAAVLGLSACGEAYEDTVNELPGETISVAEETTAEETRTGTMTGTTTETAAEETTAETTPETIAVETIAEIIAETTTAETTTAAETTVTEAQTTKETAQTDPKTGFYTTSDGLVLDPGNVPDENATWGSYEENVPYLIAQPADNINIYGVTRDEYHSWTGYYDGEEYQQSDYLIIEHDGVVDEFPAEWIERFGNPMLSAGINVGDYDGDGEAEISTMRYFLGGTVCIAYEFCIYDPEDGHYIRHELDNEQLLSEYISYTADDEAHTVTFSVKGSDKTQTISTADFSAEDVEKMYFGDIVTFEVNGNDMSVYADPKIRGCDVCAINMKLHFSDGVFSCSDPVFYSEWDPAWNGPAV